MCTFRCDVRFASCPGCVQYLWSPLPLVTSPSAQTASGSHMTEANPEPQAVHASGQHTTSTAPLRGGTSAELPSDAARKEASSIRAESTRNASPTRADTTVGKTLHVRVQRRWQGTVESAVVVVVVIVIVIAIDTVV